MPTPVIMPKFEMTQETGKVLAWLKREGDLVNKGEALLEVETDKVNQEVESPATGVLTGICAAPGPGRADRQPIAYILKPGETRVQLFRTWPPPLVRLRAWLRGGCGPSAGRRLWASRRAGRVPTQDTPLAHAWRRSTASTSGKVDGTGPMGRITREDVEAARRSLRRRPGARRADGKVRAVPAARRVARELGVDLRTVTGTGPEGRIQPEDVESGRPAAAKVASRFPLVVVEPCAEHTGRSPAPLHERRGPTVRRVVPLTNIRKTIAERMLASVREAPQFTVSLDVDMTRSLAIVEDCQGDGAGRGAGRQPAEGHADRAAGQGRGLGWWPIPAANAALQPRWNGGVGRRQRRRGDRDRPRADRPGGARRQTAWADGASPPRLTDLTTRAREGKLKLDDLQGGTFTVSNLGMFGIETFTAILNPPQAAILAVGRVSKRAAWWAPTSEIKVEIKPMASLTLTADHRVLDGASAAQFLATIQSVLEHPGCLLG